MSSLRQFRALFGVTPLVCAVVWNKVGKLQPKNSLPKYLLWEFLLLKTYANEYAQCSLTGKSGKTFQRWYWLFIQLISDLNLVCFHRLLFYLF